MNDIERAALREALRAAADEPAPDVSGLVHAVPRMMAEARRRSALRTASPLLGIAPLAARAIPRMALAAAVLVLLTAAIAWRDRATGSGATGQDIDSALENLLIGDENG
jgi:hypothetical protein